MIRVFIISFLFIGFGVQSQKLIKRSRYIDKVEMMSFWFSPNYILEDQQYGINWKLSYQMEPFLALAVQGDYFLTNKNTHSFGEIRLETGFYAFLMPHKKLSPFVYVGISRGRWWSKYSFDPELTAQVPENFVELESLDTENFHDDQSGAFGLGLYYELGKSRAFLEYRYLPDVYSNYAGIGMQFRIFKGRKYKLKRRRINK